MENKAIQIFSYIAVIIFTILVGYFAISTLVQKSAVCKEMKETMTNQPPKEQEWEKEFDEFLLNKFIAEGKKRKDETHRWMFCMDFNDVQVNDCACCIDGIDHSKDDVSCKCICHKRIRQIKSFIHQLLTQAKSQERAEILEEIEKIEIPKLTHEVWCDSKDSPRCNCNQSEAFYLVKDIQELKSLIHSRQKDE